LYPALLWIALRTARRKRTPAWAVGLVALCYALSAFPATMAYGAYVAVVYFGFVLIGSRVWGVGRRRKGEQATSLRLPTPDSRLPFVRVLVTAALATLLGVAIAAPSFVPLAQLLQRSGYLVSRANAAAEHVFPLHHLVLFLNPDHLGNPALRDWRGDRTLGTLNNYIEATVYVGVIALPLIILALANRRARRRWFWLGLLAMMLATMFGFMPVAKIVAAMPGFKFSPLTRIEMMLPIAAAYLAAAGAALLARGRFRVAIATLLAVASAADLAVFAGRFYPFLDPRLASPPMTPTIAFLQSQPKPFRIAPFFDYLWPNSAELYRLEDVRSHFSSEASYRRLLERIDPSAALTTSTVINFNSLKFDFADPLVSMLGVRYLLEQRSIDVMKWTIFANTRPGVREIAATVLPPGGAMQRHVHVDAEPFYAIEIPVELQTVLGRDPHLDVALIKGTIKGTRIVYARSFTPGDMTALNKIYIPLRPYARLGETVVLRVASIGMRVRLLTGATSVAGDAPLFYGRVTTPLIFERDFPDGRVFLNAAEVPRFHAVTRVRRMSAGEMLATKNIDYADEAIVTDARPLTIEASDAVVALRSYATDEQIVDVAAPANTLLASSEKLTPELRVTVDGGPAQPVEINGLFAGIPIPAGNHRVVFTRRLGRGWWVVAGIATVLL
ncbi:MAG: YfhO family protein, partial [Acidobacteriota bacterium]|nr:YfhO family protein [Acidobacteriota bacterium]